MQEVESTQTHLLEKNSMRTNKLLSILILVSPLAVAAWELPFNGGWAANGSYTVLETGLEVNNADGGAAWEWFVVSRPNGLCTNCKTVAILIEKPADPKIQPLRNALLDAFKYGKKIRYAYNMSRPPELNVSWLLQTVDIHRIKPGDEAFVFIK